MLLPKLSLAIYPGIITIFLLIDFEKSSHFDLVNLKSTCFLPILISLVVIISLESFISISRPLCWQIFPIILYDNTSPNPETLSYVFLLNSFKL